MLTVLTKSALRWMEDRRREAKARAVSAKGDYGFADVALNRSDLEPMLGDRVFEGALDVAYHDSARLHATYAVH